MEVDGKTGLMVPDGLGTEDTLEQKVDNLGQLLGLLADQHNQLAVAVSAYSVDVNKMLNDHNEAFEALKPLVQGIGKRQKEIQSQLDRIETRYKVISKRLKQYGPDARFDEDED